MVGVALVLGCVLLGSVFDSPAFLDEEVTPGRLAKPGGRSGRALAGDGDGLQVRWETAWETISVLLPECTEPSYGTAPLERNLLAVWYSNGNVVYFNKLHIKRLSETRLGEYVSMHEQLHACGVGTRSDGEIRTLAEKWWPIDVSGDRELPTFVGGHLEPGEYSGRGLSELMTDTIQAEPWLSSLSVKSSMLESPALCDPRSTDPCDAVNGDWKCERPSSDLPFLCGAERERDDQSLSTTAWSLLIAALAESLVALLLYSPVWL